MEQQLESPPTQLNLRKREGFRLWAVLVIRSNQIEIETLPEIHADKSDAIAQARACRDRWKGVQLGIAPVTVDAAQLELLE